MKENSEVPPSLSYSRFEDKPLYEFSQSELYVKTKIDEISSSYRTLLGWDLYQPFEFAAEHHISNRLRRAELAADENLELAQSYLNVPFKLLQDLGTVKANDPDLFNEFVGRIEDVEFERYYGVRSEIAAARVLYKKRIEFQHPDPPDFEFHYSDETLKLECTTTFVVSTSNYAQKICDKISEKATKPYSDQHTCSCSISLILSIKSLVTI